MQGMRKEEPEVDVRHAATVALQNALTFAHSNFSNDSERNYIMQIICEGTLAGECSGAEGSAGPMCQVSGVGCQVSGVRCRVSGVGCRVSGVMCQAMGWSGCP
jgi:hypothetical protein